MLTHSDITVHLLPLEHGVLIYRPLLPLAFVVNKSAAEQISAWHKGALEPDRRDPFWLWLDDVGFLRPDNPLPDSNNTYHNAVLLMTNSCNLGCSYCYADAGAKPVKLMDESHGRAIILAAEANAATHGLESFGVVFHGGGEPSTNWQVLKRLVHFARSRSLPAHISMATNLVFGSTKLQFIIDHFDELSVSFDGLPNLQDKQRPRLAGSGSSATVERNLAILDEHDFRYGIRATVAETDFSQIPALVDYVSSHYRPTGIQIEPAYAAARGSHGAGGADSGPEFSRQFIAGLEIGISRNCFVFYSGATPWRITDRFCGAATEALIGTADGDLVGCFEVSDSSHERFQDYRLGSYSPELPELIASTAQPTSVEPGLASAFQTAHQARRQTCQNCLCYYHCAGDCSIHRPGTATDSARCSVNRTVTEEILLRFIAQGEGIWQGTQRCSG